MEQHHSDRGKQQHQGDRVKDANGSQFQVFHYEHPTEGGRCVESEAKIKPTRPQRLLARAGELEEVVTQYTNHAKHNRDSTASVLVPIVGLLAVNLNLAQVSPRMQLVMVLEPSLADVVAIVHVRNHDVSDA